VDRAAAWAYFDRESEVLIDPRRLPPLRAMRLTREEIDAMAKSMDEANRNAASQD